MSFSNERMREIERHNQILLRKILTQKPTYTAKSAQNKVQPNKVRMIQTFITLDCQLLQTILCIFSDEFPNTSTTYNISRQSQETTTSN